MSLTGFNNEFNDARTREAWRQIASACRQAYVTAVIGTGVFHEGHSHIQSRIYSCSGELIGTQEKLVPTESERTWFRPGDELRVFKHRGLSFGCLICNDLWVSPGLGPYPDPRLSRQLGEKGAQMIFHSCLSGSDPEYAEYHDANLRLRAKESGCYIITANAALEDGAPVNSPTGVVTPNGSWLTKCPLEGEQSFAVDLDLEID